MDFHLTSNLGLKHGDLEYMDKKWGELWRGYLPTKTPFQNESLYQSYTTYDLSFVRKKNLGF